MIIAYGLIAALFVGMLAGLYHTGSTNGYAKAKAECVEAAAVQREAELGKINTATAVKEQEDVKAKVVYRTITKTVDKYIDRPVYRNVCLDADGLRDANAALTEPGSPASKPHDAVPEPDAVGRRDGQGSVAEAN